MSTIPSSSTTSSNLIYNALSKVPHLRRDGVEESRRDVIGLMDMVGVEIEWQQASPFDAAVSETLLDESNIQPWLTTTNADTDSGQRPNRVKLIIGEQVVQQDTLRPPPLSLGVEFSRNLLCNQMHLPRAGLERISGQGDWYLEFPTKTEKEKPMHSFAVATAFCKMLWCRDTEMKTQTGLVVFSDSRGAQAFRQDLKELRMFIDHTLFLPFLLAGQNLQVFGIALDQAIDRRSRVQVELARSLGGSNSQSIFEELALHSRTTAAIQSVCDTVRKSISLDKAQNSKLKKGETPESVEEARRRQKRQEFEEGVRYLRDALKATSEASVHCQKEVKTQLSTALSLIAHNEQRLNVQIAEAQKMIAEDTKRDQAISVQIARASRIIAAESKRDSGSMKTLAVLTMVYLPGTFVSSFLAVPFFDWQTSKVVSVNQYIWIYFVLTIPLTATTVWIWWKWQKANMKREERENGEAREDELVLRDNAESVPLGNLRSV